MIRRPPRSTRTDTLFPYTTLFRSYLHRRGRVGGGVVTRLAATFAKPHPALVTSITAGDGDTAANIDALLAGGADVIELGMPSTAPMRSAERPVGQEGVSSCRSRSVPYPCINTRLVRRPDRNNMIT